MRIASYTFGDLWWQLLRHLYTCPEIAPRGMACREQLGVQLYLEDALANVLVSNDRKLNYRFMVAEWLWIYYGHDDVATISRYNPNIAAFSDDGVTFNGSYGVPVVAQWGRILTTLRQDLWSRQAVLLIYRPPTGPTKDVPCTIALQFLIRPDEDSHVLRLHTIATMRSSDVWLGLPYDVFNFSMLANVFAAQLNVPLGSLTMQLGSSHLYDKQYDLARDVIFSEDCDTLRSRQLSEAPPRELDTWLRGQEAIIVGEPWVHYATVLRDRSQRDALHHLKESLCD